MFAIMFNAMAVSLCIFITLISISALKILELIPRSVSSPKRIISRCTLAEAVKRRCK